jgi:hypothetical protein
MQDAALMEVIKDYALIERHKIRTFESMRSCVITCNQFVSVLLASHIQVNISLCKKNVNYKANDIDVSRT